MTQTEVAPPAGYPHIPSAPPAAESGGRYAFVGTGSERLVLELVNLAIVLGTCGIGQVLGLPAHRRARWTVERTTFDGAPLKYTHAWTDDLGSHLVSSLLLFVTCGFAVPWVVTREHAHRWRGTRTADGRGFEFRGSGVEVFGLALVSFFALLLTLGLAWPWVAVGWRRWAMRNVFVADQRVASGSYRLRFDAGGLSFLVQGVLATLLVLVTLGFYMPWALATFERWAWSATSDDVSPPRRVPLGPATPGQWAIVIVAGSGFALLAVLVIVFGLSASGGASGPSTSTAGLLGGLRGRLSGAAGSPAVATTPVASPRAAPAARLRVTAVSASSWVATPTESHPPAHAFDGDATTAWQSSGASHGKGDWVEADFGGRVRLDRLRVTTGWSSSLATSGDLFPSCGHLRRVRFTFDAGQPVELDVAADQRSLELEPGVSTRTLRVTVLDVWPGARISNVCVGDIVAEGVSVGNGGQTTGGAQPTSAASPDEPTDTDCAAPRPALSPEWSPLYRHATWSGGACPSGAICGDLMLLASPPCTDGGGAAASAMQRRLAAANCADARMVVYLDRAGRRGVGALFAQSAALHACAAAFGGKSMDLGRVALRPAGQP